MKDLFDTAGIRTTYGSKIYADHVPERTAAAVERLLDAGAVLVGKTHLPEFAWSVIGVNPWYGTCHNPAQPGKTTGGSSSGNAAALAAGLCELALGSDTGGSIRIPSACCGTVGLKSQWGLIPLDGAYPLCPTLDMAGPMATTVADTALMWSVLAGAADPEPRLAGLTVGLLRKAPWVGGEYVPEPTDLAEQWVADLERLGATVVEAEMPEPEANTGRCSSTRLPSRIARRFRHAPTTTASRSARSSSARRTCTPDERGGRIRRRPRAGACYEPPVDLYVSPCVPGELPPEDVDERDVRFQLSACVRWVNLVGWAGLAIGNLQLIAPRDETVSSPQALAWERG